MEPTPSKQRQGQERKMKKGRRSWSVKEEEVLINLSYVVNGWKCENVFRTGYLIALERAMVKAFPGTDLRAQPHINSKLHVWKKYHASMTCMLALRGFSWNAKETMVKAQDDAWDLYLKADSSARTMRYRSWPFYEDWCQIYGSDIPITRENIEDLADADQEIRTDTGTDKGKEMAAEFGYRDAEEIDDENELAVRHCQDSGTEKKQLPKKRKVSNNSSDALDEAIDVFRETVNSRLDEIAERTGHERDVANAKKEVFGALCKIPGLGVQDMVIAARLLVNRTPDMELFFSLPDDARAVMGIEEYLYSRLELEAAILSAHEEISRKDKEILQLKDLLADIIRGRDELKAKCQTLGLENQRLLQKLQMKTQLPSNCATSDDENMSLSPSDCDDNYFSTTWSPAKVPSSSSSHDKCWPCDKSLPQTGKFLQAVMEAGPLLHTLLLEGPLPR